MFDLRIDDLSLEQQELWRRVNDLWDISLERSVEKIRGTLHPRYVGWDMNSPTPHSREAAIQSVIVDSPVVKNYHLMPLSIEVYDHILGIVHYTYSATFRVTGKWTEIYLNQGDQWVMIRISGRPDHPPGGRNGNYNRNRAERRI